MTVELPKDAKGREIPLDADALYDKNGELLAIYAWEYMPKLKHSKWRVRFLFDESGVKYYPDDYYLTPPDSFEKLEEDLQRIDIGGSGWFCMYAGYGKDDDSCHSECKLFKDKTPCDRQAARDIVSRIRKLRGDGE